MVVALTLIPGGQKARVALARAAYSRANIQLLDDPLSAVDPRVGRTLFDKCIGPSGLMQGSTRVLVTHQRQYLPRCDRVAVLRGGELVALGTWQDLMELQLPELVAGEPGLMVYSPYQFAVSLTLCLWRLLDCLFLYNVWMVQIPLGYSRTRGPALKPYCNGNR
jgi:ABC-type sulfate/molybdate transport systems ATPase subunit